MQTIPSEIIVAAEKSMNNLYNFDITNLHLRKTQISKTMETVDTFQSS